MTLCKGERCRWYGDASKYGRKCFYGEPQCVLGWIDALFSILRITRELKEAKR